ncbi:MAG: hypothetical protein ACI9ND_003181 [Yoonia sp.]|jgi:hypothetical protein
MSIHSQLATGNTDPEQVSTVAFMASYLDGLTLGSGPINILDVVRP